MVIIKNTLWSPLSIELSEGKKLTLGPRKTAELSEEDMQTEECQRCLRDEQVFIMPEEF